MKVILKDKPWLLFLLSTLLVLEILAFKQRIFGILLNVPQDEYQHFIVALSGRHVVDFIDKIAPMLQPVLDFSLLRFFWIPLLGQKEITLRLPALFYSLLKIAFIFPVVYFYFSNKGKWLAYIISVGISLWAITHTTEASLATMTRHYSLVALISLFWWTYLILYRQKIFCWRFFILSLLFVNAHFFALAIVAGAYAWVAITKFYTDKRISLPVILSLMTPVALLLITWIINKPAMNWLLLSPPTSTTSVGFSHLGKTLFTTASIWWSFFSYTDWPGTHWLSLIAVIFPLIALIGFNKDIGRIRLFFLMALVQPAFYLLCSLKSDYAFGTRYHSIFYGSAFVVLVFFFENLFKKNHKGQKIFIAATLLLFVAPSLLKIRAENSLNAWAGVPAIFKNLNMSENYHEQKFVQDRELPILWIHDACYEGDNPVYYFSYNSSNQMDSYGYGRSYRHGFLIADSFGCEDNLASMGSSFKNFFANYKRNIVVIRSKFLLRKDCLGFPINPPAGVDLKLMPESITNKCIWTAEGVKDTSTLRKIIEMVKIPRSTALDAALKD